MVEVVRVQVLGSAEKGVHRALRVGRDKDEAAGGRRLLRPRRRIELDAKRAYVVAEHFAKLIRGDPADEPGPASQRGYARSEEHTSELQSLMRISYAVFC